MNYIKTFTKFQDDLKIILSRDPQATVKDVESEILDLAKKTGELILIARDNYASENNILLTGKNLDTPEKVKKTVLDILNVKGTSIPDRVIKSKIVTINGKNKTFHKVALSPYNEFNVEGADGKRNSLANEIFANMKQYNDKRKNKIFVTRETPRSLKQHYQRCDKFGFDIRKLSNKKIKFSTKTIFSRVEMRPEVKVRTIKGKIKSDWSAADPFYDDSSEIEPLLVKFKEEFAELKVEIVFKSKDKAGSSGSPSK